MIDKKELLKNLRNYSAEQVADAVKNNVVSLYELGHNTKGAFTPLLKREVKAILDNSTIISEVSISADKASISATHSSPASLYKEEETDKSNQSDDIDSFDIFDIEEDTDYADEEVEGMEEEVSYDESKNHQNTSNKPLETTMFARPFSFTGRIRRTEYWFTLFIILVIIIFIASIFEIGSLISDQERLTFSILSIPLYWFFFAQRTKRCHDLGNSGWYQLIPFYFIWMLFAEGESGNNIYGGSPK